MEWCGSERLAKNLMKKMSRSFPAQFDEVLQSINDEGVTSLYNEKRKKSQGNAVLPCSASACLPWSPGVHIGPGKRPRHT